MAAGYALVFWGNPARAAFRDGLRCAQRYPRMAAVLAGLGFWYSVAQEIQRYHTSRRQEDGALSYDWWNGWNPPELQDSASAAFLPAAEGVAGLFNCLISTFPVSILAAFLLWIDWNGSRATIGSALRKHYPRTGIWFLIFLLVSSLCCVAKPILFLTYEKVLEQMPSKWTAFGIDLIYRLAFLFEYSFAVFIQISLITVAYVWVRGITYDGDSIRDFALRRLGAVMRWALIVYAVSFLVIDLPLILDYFLPEFQPAPVVMIGRWVIAGLLLALPLIQIRLVFHNENVGQCLRDQKDYWLKHRGRFFWFAAVAFMVFYPLAAADHYIQMGLGLQTAAGIAWNLLFPLIWAPFAAWMLASWVCLIKQTESRKPGVDDWIVF